MTILELLLWHVLECLNFLILVCINPQLQLLSVESTANI